MAEDVSRPEQPPDGRPLLPDRRPDESLRPPPAPPPAETLPELRLQEPEGQLDRWRGAPPPSTYAPRFRALTGGLVGLAIGALVAAAVALFAPGFQTGPRWSSWEPDRSGPAGAAQIASHVAPAYRLPTGEPMVRVTGGEVKSQLLDAPAQVAITESASEPSPLLVKGQSVLYQLCGAGRNCAIRGTPSEERALLLRREVLEMALYSFRYLKGVDNVVAILPPTYARAPSAAGPIGTQPRRVALFFRRKPLEPILERPLGATLPAPPPTVASIEDAPEAGLVKRLTDPSFFNYSYKQTQDLTPVLLLDRGPGP